MPYGIILHFRQNCLSLQAAACMHIQLCVKVSLKLSKRISGSAIGFPQQTPHAGSLRPKNRQKLPTKENTCSTRYDGPPEML